jgi:ATP-dependent Zn protease
MTSPRSLVTAAILAACWVFAAAVPAGAVKAPPETYAALQKQIAAGQVRTATISRSKHTARIKLKSGQKYVVSFPAANQTTLVDSLRAKGAKVHVDRKHKSSGHFRLRYVVLIVIAAIALAAGVAWLVQRRRRGPAVADAP